VEGNMKVRDFMTSPVITVPENCTLEEAAKIMLKKNFGALPVVSAAGDLCGIITETDFAAREKGIPFSLFRFPQLLGQWLPKQGVEKIYKAARKLEVRECMRRRVITVTEEDSLETVLQRMLENNVHRLPVLRGGKPVGMVSRHDLLKLVLERWPKVSEA
jgi:CBS domain-containing protein